MSALYEESKRVRNFREEIIKYIPRLPNNRDTLKLLEAKSLTDLLIVYLNWASRHVPPRPRTIHIEPTLTADRRWKTLSADTKTLLDKARRGDDLTPHLSLKTRREGFRPCATSTDPNIDRWTDKDFLLNVMGYHHFHLSHILEVAGHTKRVDDVLFTEITREKFTAIGFFNHSVFESPKVVTQSLEVERERLWKIFVERNSRGIPPGSVYAPMSISSSGHRTNHALLAIRHTKIINTIDQKLDETAFVGSQFGTESMDIARKIKPAWYLNYLDLGIYDKKSKTFCLYHKGPI